MMAFSSDRQVLDIAYSTLGIAPINTSEHYRLAASCGFPALKGDIRPTSDGGLIMCHDEGFTLDDSGRITTFDPDNYRPILDMTFSECVSMEYNAFSDSLGYYAKVTSYEDFVRICSDTEKICFTTVRNDLIPQTCAELFRIIKKYDMEERLMVNSFTYEALVETRKYSQSVPVSYVQDYHAVLTDPVIDATEALGNAITTMFSFPSDGFDAILESKPVIERALARNIPLFQAIMTRAEDRERAMQLGFSGFQISCLMPPYARPHGAIS